MATKVHMLKINFNFNCRKTTQALNYFAIKAGGTINRMKAIKLVYLADRYHLRKYCRLITNDIYFAMDNGPVASGVKDIAEQSKYIGTNERNYASDYIGAVPPYGMKSKKDIDNDVFSVSDIEALEYSWNKFGHLDREAIVKLTHKYPDWYKHKLSLEQNSRIQMDLSDFFDDPNSDVDKCFELTDEDRDVRREKLEEMLYLESIWR